MDIQSGIHAYIISGAERESRERLAYSLARKALGGKSYGEALPSKLATAAHLADRAEPTAPDAAHLAHPDLHEVSPDGAEIKVAQAREVREMAQIRPNEAPRQVFILHDADRMNTNAQNALLATIEEPPTPCLFLLVCANERALLPTIRSRCATIHSTTETLREYGATDLRSTSNPAPHNASNATTSPDVDPAVASRLAGAMMSTSNPRGASDPRSNPQSGTYSADPDAAEAVLPLSKLKGEDAINLVDAARAACLRAAAREPAGSDAAARALDGADFAAKCLDMLSANVSPAQVAAWIVAHA